MLESVRTNYCSLSDLDKLCEYQPNFKNKRTTSNNKQKKLKPFVSLCLSVTDVDWKVYDINRLFC